MRIGDDQGKDAGVPMIHLLDDIMRAGRLYCPSPPEGGMFRFTNPIYESYSRQNPEAWFFDTFSCMSPRLDRLHPLGELTCTGQPEPDPDHAGCSTGQKR